MKVMSLVVLGGPKMPLGAAGELRDQFGSLSRVSRGAQGCFPRNLGMRRRVKPLHVLADPCPHQSCTATPRSPS